MRIEPTYEGDDDYPIECDSVVAGDEIRFERALFTGSYRKPKFAGYELVTATVVRESYGEEKQQHTFTLRLQTQSVHTGKLLLIKGRNLYRHGVWRKPWPDEESRLAVLTEKYERGDAARAARAARRALQEDW